jgi:non-ribosomal peptide synthetase component F
MTQNSRDSLIEELASLMLADEETSQSAAGAVGEVASREQPSSAGLLPIPRGGPLRPSRVQERIWLQEREAPGLWNIGRTLAVYGRLNESALQTALDGLLARHEPLRTRFAVEASGALLQVIDAASRAAMDVREAREPEIHELVKRHQEQLFDLEKGPLFRILLLRLAPEEHVVSLALHHSICDGWSLAVLAQDLRELYQAAVQDRSAHLPPLRIQYADYAAWQRSENTTRSLAFWKMTLDDPPSPLKLSSAPAAANSGEAVRIVRPVPQALAKALFRYAREQRASLFMILLAGWALAAYRRTRQEDFCLSTTVAGRDRLELEPLIGSFVNVLPLRMRIAKDATGREIVEQARQVALSGLEHQSVSFEQILDEVPGLRQAGRATPLPLVLRHQNLQAIEISAWSTGLQLRELTAGEQRMATTDLDVQYLGDERSGLSVAAVYNVERLDRDAVEAVLDDAELMLQRLEETPDVPVSELLQLTQDEQEEQRAALCGVERPRATWNVTARFAEQVRLRPGALACQDTEQSLTYRELDRRSEIVARALCEQGAGPHQRVVLFLRRSVDFVAALLGVWKARSVYVPLDPAYPADFAKSIIASVDASVLISGTGLPPDLAGTKSTVLTLQTLWAEFLHTEVNFEPA